MFAVKMKLMIDNWNKKLSRNRKRKIERKFKRDKNMKLLLKKIKSEKKKKNESFDKIKELEIELVKIKCAKKPDKLQSALKKIN